MVRSKRHAHDMYRMLCDFFSVGDGSVWTDLNSSREGAGSPGPLEHDVNGEREDVVHEGQGLEGPDGQRDANPIHVPGKKLSVRAVSGWRMHRHTCTLSPQAWVKCGEYWSLSMSGRESSRKMVFEINEVECCFLFAMEVYDFPRYASTNETIKNWK